MKISLPLLVTGAALLAPIIAQAQPGLPGRLPPGVNPGVANQAAQRAQQSDVVYWYNLLPANIFGAFGNADRLDLLQSKGAIYDKNRGFIEVPAPGDANQNDVEKLQVKLYQGQQGLMVAVSQVVWNQPRVKGALAFFALGQDGQLFDVTKQVFPFDLTTPQNAPANDNANTGDAATAPVAAPDAPNAPANSNKRSAPPINAYLPRQGTTISTGVPETDVAGDDYNWNGTVFEKTEARDTPRDNQ